MKYVLSLLGLLLMTNIAWSQKMKFKIHDLQDTTVFLVRYTGSKLYYADTTEMKKGIVEFDSKKHTPGLYALLLPGQRFFEFLVNNEEIHIETVGPNYGENMKVVRSEENRRFKDYMNYLSTQRKNQQTLQTTRDAAAKGSAEYEQAQKQLDNLNETTIAYQKKFVEDNKNFLVGKMIDLTIDVEIPEVPSTVKEEEKQQWRYFYYRDHFFDKFDFSNDALVHLPIFGHRMETYFSNKMLVQHWDTILTYAYKLIDRMDPKSKAWEFTVQYVTSTFGKSQIMGMDKVYTLMADKYYCTPGPNGKSLAHWMTPDKLEELCDKIKVQKHLVMGAVAPNLILPDTTDVAWDKLNYVNLHKLKADYTIMYFWDPECGHCKKITPKLSRLFNEKMKGRNVEVFAIGKANGAEYKKWKDAIAKYEMQNFKNVAVTETLLTKAKAQVWDVVPRYTTGESLNYHLTYDIYSTPQVILLDKDKKIIAKRITISQLEDMLDRLQDHSDAPKLFPQEDEDDQQMKHN